LVKLGPFSLINRRESKIVDELKGYFKIIQKTVDSFVGMVKAIGDGNDAEAKRFFQAILDGEKEADSVHRAMSMEIAEGAFFGGIREDVLNLLEMMDNIPDSAKDAARFLESEERLDDFALSLLRSDEMKGFISNLQLAVGALGELIAAFDLGKKELLARLPAVEDREEDADTFKDELMKQLFKASSNPNPVTVIQMRDFLFVADDIADYAEDSSDVILVLVAKGYD
jgi:predicted phosphate transport protein (TIGR00153 family)